MGKILITGAEGFVGSHLIDHLLEDGVKKSDLRLFVYNKNTHNNISHTNLDIFYGDIRNLQDVQKALKGIDIIYHLAAVTMNGEGGLYHDVNYKGTKNIIKVAKNNKIKKIVFFSTIAIYGLPAFIGDRENINEESELRVIGEYADSKYKAEQVVKKSGVNYAIIRPTTVYGPRDKAGVYQLFMSIKKGYFLRVGKGDNKMDYVNVKDLVDGARKAEKSRIKNSEYILGSGKPTTFRKLSAAVFRSLGMTFPSWYIPRSIGLVIGYIAELFSKITGISLPLTMDRVRVMTANYYFDSSKAINKINYSPNTSLEKGISEVAQWINRYNNKK